MKQFYRFVAAVTACCAAAIPCSSYATVSAATTEETALNNAEIVINTVNNIRVSYGLNELAVTPLLLEVSNTRAEELAENFSHNRPDGSLCFTALKEAGITYSFVAENIAAGRADPVSTVDQWMNSEGHRENILGENYTHIGIGYYYDADSTYGHYWSMFLIGVTDGSEPYVYDDQYIPERELGDVNGTKSVNASDASTILQYSATMAVGREYPVVASFETAADVNADGSIDAVDASIVLAYSAAKGSGKDVTIQDFIW